MLYSLICYTCLNFGLFYTDVLMYFQNRISVYNGGAFYQLMVTNFLTERKNGKQMCQLKILASLVAHSVLFLPILSGNDFYLFLFCCSFEYEALICKTR